MNKILVFIYSYKGKYLKDVIDNLLEMSSKENEIFFNIVDQHPLERTESFKLYTRMNYKHVYWDLQRSPCLYKSEMTHESIYDYILILGNDILLSKNWDKVLIDKLIDNLSIISGSGFAKPKVKDLFFIDSNRHHTDAFELSQYIDRDFIFGKSSTIKHLQYPNYIKFYGEEELVSLIAFCNDIDIYCCPSGFYKKIDKDSLLFLYTPFSIYHNYNKVIQLMKTGQNGLTNLFNLPRRIKEFEKYHDISFSDLEFLPFDSNDVEYDQSNMEFDDIDQRKFMTRTHTIR